MGVLMRPQHTGGITCRWSLEEDWSKRCPGIHTLILNQHISKWLPALYSLENPEEMERNGFKHMFSFCSFQKTVSRRWKKASSTCENSYGCFSWWMSAWKYTIMMFEFLYIIKVIIKDVTKIHHFIVLVYSLKVDKIDQ